jgi:hypothetical protein
MVEQPKIPGQQPNNATQNSRQFGMTGNQMNPGMQQDPLFQQL